MISSSASQASNLSTIKHGVDFGWLLESPLFRSDLLYFIRMAGNYAAQIFGDVRDRAQKKHARELQIWLGADEARTIQDAQSRKALLKRLRKNYQSANRPKLDNQLWEALVLKEPWFDPYKTGFTDIIRAMPTPMQTRLERALKEDHALPWDLHGFETALSDLTAYRHMLEHPERPATVTDQRLTEILSLMLIPHLTNHLAGRVHHHGRKAKMRTSDLEALLEAIRAASQHAIAARREVSKHVNGLKLKLDNDSLRQSLKRKKLQRHLKREPSKAEIAASAYEPTQEDINRLGTQRGKIRKDMEQRKKGLKTLYKRYFDDDTWPRYNYQNFLIRYGFIGKSRIKALENKLLPQPEMRPQRRDFMLDIEPLYLLASDIALIFHAWLGEQEAKHFSVRSKAKVGPVIPAIRNALAHGEFFWSVSNSAKNNTPYSLSEMLTALCTMTNDAGHSPSLDDCNNLVTQLEGILKKQRKYYLYEAAPGDDPNQRPPPRRISTWSPAQRDKYGAAMRKQSNATLQRRKPLQRLCINWLSEIKGWRKQEWPKLVKAKTHEKN